jgi:hypothetical protein
MNRVSHEPLELPDASSECQITSNVNDEVLLTGICVLEHVKVCTTAPLGPRTTMESITTVGAGSHTSGTG